MTSILETSIAGPIRSFLEAQGLTVRSEVPVIHPTEGSVSIDLVALYPSDAGDEWSVIEVKRTLNSELEAQAMRWRGLANRIYYAHAPQARVTKVTRERRERLDSYGFGHITIGNGVNIIKNGTHFDANTRLIESAFHAHDGSHDAVAGSAAVKRMTPERCQWDGVRKYITENWSVSGKDIRRDVEGQRRVTDKQLRKAIDLFNIPGVTYYEVNGITAYTLKDRYDHLMRTLKARVLY